MSVRPAKQKQALLLVLALVQMLLQRLVLLLVLALLVLLATPSQLKAKGSLPA